MKTYSLEDVFNFIRRQPPGRAVDCTDNLHEEEGTVLTHFAKDKKGLNLGGRIHNDAVSFICSEGQWGQEGNSRFMECLQRATFPNRIFTYKKVQEFLDNWMEDSMVGLK